MVILELKSWGMKDRIKRSWSNQILKRREVGLKTVIAESNPRDEN